MKINLEGWEPFKTLQNSQWYHIEDRPNVMNKLATVLGASATSASIAAIKNRYFRNPYESKEWYDLDGEIARIASEVLNE